MTPALKLKEHDKKPLLSCILKFFLPGNSCTTRSTQITEAPMVQVRGPSQSLRCELVVCGRTNTT